MSKVSSDTNLIVREIELRYKPGTERPTYKAGYPHTIAREMTKKIGDCAQEHMMALALNARNMVTDEHLAAKGGPASTQVCPGDVFRAMILSGAVAFVLVHNHPTGDTSPSQDDRKFTQIMKENGKLLGIPLLDHVIIGPGGEYTSLREKGDL